MGNLARARRLIEDVAATGAREFCVCAGSRNSPLLAVLGEACHPERSRGIWACGSALPHPTTQIPRLTLGMTVRLFSFVDERSAAFFALGRSKLTGAPVAVVTTSGTAVAELLPATIEAFYSGIPLILITADRPARYRGTGAPQSIEQVGIFGPYATTEWTGRAPWHLNIEFDEPLIE